MYCRLLVVIFIGWSLGLPFERVICEQFRAYKLLFNFCVRMQSWSRVICCHLRVNRERWHSDYSIWRAVPLMECIDCRPGKPEGSSCLNLGTWGIYNLGTCMGYIQLRYLGYIQLRYLGFIQLRYLGYIQLRYLGYIQLRYLGYTTLWGSFCFSVHIALVNN